MTEIINKTSAFVKANIKWILIMAAGIIGLILDKKYESKGEAAIHYTKFDNLEEEFGLYKQRLKTLEGRFEKKLKITTKHTQEIDDNENNIIRLQEKK